MLDIRDATNHAPVYSYNELVEDKQVFFATNDVAFVGFVVLIWDHILTFGDEVEFIWKPRKTLLSYLFLLNRYITPLGFIVYMYAYMSPSFADVECKKFVTYEGSMITAGLFIAALMMLRRLMAIYQSNQIIVFLAATILAAWLCITIVIIPEASHTLCGKIIESLELSRESAIHHSPVVHSCTEINDARPRDIASACMWLLVAYDTFVVGCILTRAVHFNPYENVRTIARALVVDGLRYYIVVLTVNVLDGVLVITAPDGIKNIFSLPKLHLTVAVMSRITLNLPKQHQRLTRRNSRHWEDATSILPTIELTSHSRR